jgi:hypothetical protein
MFLAIKVDYGRVQRPSPLSISGVTHFEVTNADASIQVLLRKRSSSPATFCQIRGDHAIQLGYRAKEGEFLHITLTDTGEVSIRRDMHCTLPLFYVWQDGVFLLSNDYAEIVKHCRRLHIDTAALTQALIGRDHYTRTLWQEVHTIEEGQTVVVWRTGVRCADLPQRSWTKSNDVLPTNPRLFPQALEASFERLLAKLSLPTTAFELSGGLDSSTLPLYMGKYHPGVISVGATLRFPGEHHHSQHAKLAALVSVVGIESLVQEQLISGHNHPLSRIVGDGSKAPNFVPLPLFLEVYHEPTKNIGGMLASQGVDTIITGIGGDELFEHRLSLEEQLGFGPETRMTCLAQSPPYVTQVYRDALMQSVPDYALQRLSVLPITLHSAHALRNNTYIEQGVWPVSQFTDAELYTFCQGLPIHFRANKNILRAYYQAHQFPEVIYRPVVNEDFEEFFAEGFYNRLYDRTMETLLGHSVTARLGYIDDGILWQTYTDAVKDRNPDWLFPLYCWMCSEIELQRHLS